MAKTAVKRFYPVRKSCSGVQWTVQRPRHVRGARIRRQSGLLRYVTDNGGLREIARLFQRRNRLSHFVSQLLCKHSSYIHLPNCICRREVALRSLRPFGRLTTAIPSSFRNAVMGRPETSGYASSKGTFTQAFPSLTMRFAAHTPAQCVNLR
ncbi:hypothetical protein KCP69_25820 [Salmonella enterica subsp. enterica]|nr:hypothetical protein KCP69_25820 [Salmonella enterica subsp. enterica]